MSLSPGISVKDVETGNEHSKHFNHSFFSNSFFCWLYPFLLQGYRNPLQERDIPSVNSRDGCQALADEAEKLWTDQVRQHGDQASISKVLLRIQKKEIILGVVLSIFQGILASVARPLLLGKIIKVVSDTESSTEEGILIAMSFGVVILLEGVLQAQTKQLLSAKLGTRFFSWSTSLIQKKAGTVSSISVHDAQLRESAIVSSDITRMIEDWRWLCLFPYIVTALIGGVTILILVLGVSSLVGCGIMFSIAFMNWRITKVIKKVEEKDFALGDKRMGIMQEILSGIKAIKMMGWEKPFQKMVTEVRHEETGYIRQFRTLVVTSINGGRASPILASALSIMTVAIIAPEDLIPANIFVAISSFQGLRLPLISLPQHAAMFTNTFVSFARIRKFLLLDDAPLPDVINSLDENVLVLENASFTYDGNSNPDSASFTLNDMSFAVKKNGFLCAVVGRVGSGKTTLLSSVLGSTFKTQGILKLCHRVGYVPQKPFVMSGTLQDNILMGKLKDKDLFNKVVKASALDQDLKNLPDGRYTEIGERGQTLSGGQQQRLSIARALYHQPQLLILDDPLSAVDPEVATSIFKRSILDLVSEDKSVLMTLNQLHLLHYFDHIIVLKEGGIAEQGSFESLSNNADSLLNSMMKGIESNMEETQPQEEIEEEPRMMSSMNAKEEADELNVHVLVTKETGKQGAVGSSVMGAYFRAMGWKRVPFSFLFAICAYSFMAAADLYLANWISNSSTTTEQSEHIRNAGIYIMFAFLNVIGVEVLSIHNTFSSIHASKSVHDESIDTMMHAPISWYEETPSGRVLGRFGGDLSMVDRQLSFIFDDVFQFFFLLSALCVVICVIVPQVIGVVVLGLCLFAWQTVAIDKSNREVKRYSNQALSPIITNLSETVHARDMIRSMKLGGFFSERHYTHTDTYVSFIYMSHSFVNMSTMFSGILSFVLSSSAAVVVVVKREEYSAALVGLALTYSFLVPYFLSILSVVLPMGFAALTSLERILEYSDLPQEPLWHTSIDDTLVEWPSLGKIEFEDASLVYRPGLPPALHNVSLCFQGGEKIGIVGRTGAGKSSLTLLLFRIHDPATGRVLIDGADISTIGLQTLRKSLTIIPQTPLLLEGDVKDNLDPFQTYSDDDHFNAMKKVGLDPAMLQMPQSAHALSVGERQLLSLARALLRNSLRIVVMDEPTANIDMESDDAIQKIVREEFRHSTVITIAHRLSSIIESDKVLVMDQGKVVEFDAPEVLLENTSGYFYSMVNCLGESTAKGLTSRASSRLVG